MINVPAWVVWMTGLYLMLNAASNALSETDRDMYRFFVRFIKGLALNFSALADKELTQLHLNLPRQIASNEEQKQ